MRTLWLVAGCAVLEIARAWAGTPSPQQAVHDFERRFNSRYVDELLGAVDYEFVYARQGSDAYPLAAVKALQEEGRAHFDAAAATWTIQQGNARIDSTEVAVHTVGPVGNSKQVLREKGRAGGPNQLRKGRSNVFRGDSAPNDKTWKQPVGYTQPLVAAEHKKVGPKPARKRFPKDKRGDPTSFNLDEVNVTALLNRRTPERLAQLSGVELGLRLTPPPKRKMTRLTNMEEEHSLAERRLMRLELRELYRRMASGVYLKIAVENIEEQGDQAIAEISWRFTDWPSRKQGQTARLNLRKTNEAWQLEQAWDLVQAINDRR